MVKRIFFDLFLRSLVFCHKVLTELCGSRQIIGIGMLLVEDGKCALAMELLVCNGDVQLVCQLLHCLVRGTEGTGAFGSSYKAVKKLADELHIPVADEEFHCKGAFAIFNKKHPNADDLAAAAQFGKDFMAKYEASQK